MPYLHTLQDRYDRMSRFLSVWANHARDCKCDEKGKGCTCGYNDALDHLYSYLEAKALPKQGKLPPPICAE